MNETLKNALTSQLKKESRIVFLHEDTIYEIFENSEKDFEWNSYDEFNQEPTDGGVYVELTADEIIDEVTQGI